MVEHQGVPAADSGLIELTADRIEKVPEGPGVFMMVSPGQKVIYVGHAGDSGLRESLWRVFEQEALPAASYFRYQSTADAATAEALASERIEALKPPHNIGYGRFRNGEVSVPKQARSVRQAAPNP
ncbi:MAG: hypothetical protein ACE5HV_07135 [Acidobacteriota bacterium]